MCSCFIFVKAMRSLETLAKTTGKSVTDIMEPHKEVLQDMIPPKKHLLRHQPANAQIGLMVSTLIDIQIGLMVSTLLDIQIGLIVSTLIDKQIGLIVSILTGLYVYNDRTDGTMRCFCR